MTGADATAMPLSNRDLAYRMQLQFLVEQFYYAEAAALDQRRYDDWLTLFTDDVHYWMPVRRTRTSNEIDREFTAPGAVAYFRRHQVDAGEPCPKASDRILLGGRSAIAHPAPDHERADP